MVHTTLFLPEAFRDWEATREDGADELREDGESGDTNEKGRDLNNDESATQNEFRVFDTVPPS